MPRMRYKKWEGLSSNRLRHICSAGTEAFSLMLQDLHNGSLSQRNLPKTRRYGLYETKRSQVELPEGVKPALKIERSIATDVFFIVPKKDRLHVYLVQKGNSDIVGKVGEFY